MSWVTRFEEEEDWKAVLDDYFRQWFDIHDDPRNRVDRLFFPKGEEEGTMIDYKFDDNISKTGQVFIELYRDKDSNKFGWAYTSRADMVIYLAVPDTIYMFEPQMIWKWAWDWSKRFKVILTKRGSTGILVPEKEFAKHCTRVRRLT